jgi:hypothetical protein
MYYVALPVIAYVFQRVRQHFRRGLVRIVVNPHHIYFGIAVFADNIAYGGAVTDSVLEIVRHGVPAVGNRDNGAPVNIGECRPVHAGIYYYDSCHTIHLSKKSPESFLSRFELSAQTGGGHFPLLYLYLTLREMPADSFFVAIYYIKTALSTLFFYFPKIFSKIFFWEFNLADLRDGLRLYRPENQTCHGTLHRPHPDIFIMMPPIHLTRLARFQAIPPICSRTVSVPAPAR